MLVSPGGCLSLEGVFGFTFFEDKTKVGSKENQMLFFDGSKPHASTTCTDQQVRINIGFNYL